MSSPALPPLHRTRAARRVLSGLAAGGALAAPALSPGTGTGTTRAIAAVPEPGSLVLLGAGLLGVALIGYLRRRRKGGAAPPPKR